MLETPIAEEALVGPFDFEENNHVPQEAWDRFREKAAELNHNVQSAFSINCAQASNPS
jgi:hypothetical protein